MAGGFETVRDIVTNVSVSQSMRPIAPALRQRATGGCLNGHERSTSAGAVFTRVKSVSAQSMRNVSLSKSSRPAPPVRVYSCRDLNGTGAVVAAKR